MPTQTFSTGSVTPYSFVIPAGVISIEAECWGSGGGACSFAVNGGGAGGGGGGGAYSLQTGIPCTPGDTWLVWVGFSGSSEPGDGGTAGADSYFQSPGGTIYARASGGMGAYRTTGGAGGSAYGTYPGGAGGNGFAGAAPSSGGGGGGGAATSGGSGSSGSPGGIGGFAPGGTYGGGTGGQGTTAGISGSAPGAGGGGGGVVGSFGSDGGDGADGQVTLTWVVGSFQQVMSGVAKIAANVQQVMSGVARITNVPQSGYSVIRFAVAPASGHSITCSYYRLGADLLVCEITPEVAARAAVSGGTGKAQLLSQDTSNTNQAAGLQETQQALQAYSDLPITITLETYRAGILPGMFLELDMSGSDSAWNLPAYLDGTWLVQEVQGQFTPNLPDRFGPGLWDASTFPWSSGAPWLTTIAQYGAILYTITLVSIPTPNWVQFWTNLANKSQ